MNKKARIKLIVRKNSFRLICQKKEILNNHYNIFNKSSVENILTLDCCLNASSSNQIRHLLNTNDKAKYGSSFVELGCGEILFASDKNSLYVLSGNDSIFSSS